ncbi:MAG: signal protein [Giesbergeria sp.]|nr:signal protein [Giesbergeria sp.]MBP8091218.1 signal protein [Giesbergeria sp.]
MTSRTRTWAAVTAGLFCAAAAFAQTTTAPAPSMPGSGTSTTTPAMPMDKNHTDPGAKMGSSSGMPAAKGAHGEVWANKDSKTYHCEGTKSYGTTKSGEYMTESAAKAQGYKVANGKACAK